jgi:hypothetical protein
MSGKLLKEIIEKHIKKDGCFASLGLFQVITSLDCLSS